MHERLPQAATRRDQPVRRGRLSSGRRPRVAMHIAATLMTLWSATSAAPLAASVPRNVPLTSEPSAANQGRVRLFDRSGMLAVDRARDTVYVGTAGRGVFEIGLGESPLVPRLRCIAPGLWTTAMATTAGGALWFGGFDGS